MLTEPSDRPNIAAACGIEIDGSTMIDTSRGTQDRGCILHALYSPTYSAHRWSAISLAAAHRSVSDLPIRRTR
ncbi:hypothetical protein DDT46_13805 [Mycobacteroides abscessus]|uniref:hypothetical protein n=1 Tax=Mycobacteroides abscessus TaxID=36809 RepID=UPI000C26BEA6|nr:hypothetical protein [Mycobacteroides abscessus]AWG64763.1 hypothetical protein DDT46_13805 [Mycobacteroides abscessus]RIS83601.1 hypothetical protein D2E44_10625 [Mycobacteroides abscessus]